MKKSNSKKSVKKKVARSAAKKAAQKGAKKTKISGTGSTGPKAKAKW